MRILRVCLVAVCVFLSGCVTFHAGAPLGVTDVIAHRGASYAAPENTMAAFRLAHDMKADWFELDCHLSRDGMVVVFHDNTLERIVGIDTPVSDMDFSALHDLDVGSWKNEAFKGERMPSLAEALDFARGRIGVYVEIKNADDDTALMDRLLEMAAHVPVMDARLATAMRREIELSGTRNLPLTRETIARIRERRMEREIVIQSFSPVVCAIAKIEAPDLRVELLSGVAADKHAEWELVCRWTFLLDLNGLNLNHEGLTAGRLAVIQGAEKSVAVWTVNDRAAMRRFADMGVDAIITDRPDMCLRVLGRAR